MFLVCDPRMYPRLGELMHSSLFSRAVYFRRFADPLFKQKLDNTRVDPLLDRLFFRSKLELASRDTLGKFSAKSYF